MKYLLIPIVCCFFSLVAFSQNAPTVTLIFASTANTTYNAREAVIDGVSYYSEEPAGSNKKKSTESVVAVDPNIIWLNNFQPGKHTIEVYNIKKGTHNVRTNTPVYSSTFIIKKGFDTKITVKTDGNVQFSERADARDIPGDVKGKNNNKTIAGQPVKNVYHGSSTNNIDKKNEDSYNNQNNDITERHSRKRIDTAIIMGNGNGDTKVINPHRKNALNANDKDADAPRQNIDNGRIPMSDDQFTRLYEKLRNQWRPGQKMKTLNNEFSTGANNFTTEQAKQLIKLLTEEGNRLKVAKLSYQHITDPEHFNEMDEILHYKASRKELDNFVKEGQN